MANKCRFLSQDLGTLVTVVMHKHVKRPMGLGGGFDSQQHRDNNLPSQYQRIIASINIKGTLIASICLTFLGRPLRV